MSEVVEGQGLVSPSASLNAAAEIIKILVRKFLQYHIYIGKS
jgi:hypothetical protein